MSLITLEEYKNLTDTTETTDDALITLLLDACTTQIENYCNRTFEAADYIEWFNATNKCLSSYRLDHYPVNVVKFIGYREWALSIENGDTQAYTINITGTTLTITNESLTSTTFDLTDATYETLSELDTEIEAELPNLTVTVNDNVNQLSRLLVSDKTYVVDDGETIDIDGATKCNSEFTIEQDTIYGISNGVIVYNAGYNTIPSDLQLVCANIIRDSLNVQMEELSTAYKQESVTNHSYTLADNVKAQSIIASYIDNYSATLNYYRRVIMG